MKHQNLEFKWMCLLFLALLLSPPLLWGQNHSIKGQIVDAKSNEPLIGVNITVEGTSNGTISDIDGRFTLHYCSSIMLWQKVVEMTKAYKIWAKRCIVEPYPKQKKRNKNVFYTHNFLTLLL